jgi:hypothetical protein
MAEVRLSDADIIAQIPKARAREHVARRLGHRARTARFDRATGRVVVELSSGILFAFPVTRIPDLSVAGLLLSAVDPTERARHLASLAGRATSAAKAAAARANGRRGGRPRKAAV